MGMERRLEIFRILAGKPLKKCLLRRLKRQEDGMKQGSMGDKLSRLDLNGADLGSYLMVSFSSSYAEASESAATILLNHVLYIFSITVNWYK
jgi:hypothetical protein